MPYSVEHAPSGRATCKKCRSKIELGTLRIGMERQMADFTAKLWFHPECVTFGRMKHLDSVDDIDGFKSLKPAEQAQIQAALSKGSSSAASTPQKKRKVRSDSDSDDDDKKDSDKTAELTKLTVAELKKRLTALGLDTKGKKAELVERLAAADDDEEDKKDPDEEKAEKLEEELSRCTIDKLKSMLRANSQKVSGTKPELIDRIVDSKLYGCLPRCTSCGGGQLKVRYPSKWGHKGQGSFYCTGYYDDDHFVRCSYSTDSAQRIPWVDA